MVRMVFLEDRQQLGRLAEKPYEAVAVVPAGGLGWAVDGGSEGRKMRKPSMFLQRWRNPEHCQPCPLG